MQDTSTKFRERNNGTKMFGFLFSRNALYFWYQHYDIVLADHIGFSHIFRNLNTAHKTYDFMLTIKLVVFGCHYICMNWKKSRNSGLYKEWEKGYSTYIREIKVYWYKAIGFLMRLRWYLHNLYCQLKLVFILKKKTRLKQ